MITLLVIKIKSRKKKKMELFKSAKSEEMNNHEVIKKKL